MLGWLGRYFDQISFEKLLRSLSKNLQLVGRNWSLYFGDQAGIDK